MKVRLATRDDAAEVRAIYAHYVECSPVTFETDVPTVAEMADRIERVLPGHPWLVATSDGSLAGYAYGCQLASRSAFRWSVETTVYVREDLCRHGVGETLYATLLELLRRQGYQRALAAIALPNAASVGLHERLGFRPSGVQRRVGWKLGAWHDLGWWALDLAQGTAEPDDPVPLDRLGDEVLERVLSLASRAPRRT